jgi:hypothetical protein
MTREDIIKAMGESGVGTMLLGVQHDKAVERLTRFAALVAAAEREACAKVCEDEIRRIKPVYSPTADIILRRIRERSQS